MIKHPTTLLKLLALSIFLYNCAGEPQVNFLVNSRDYVASETEPSESDSTKWYETYTGFKISLKDATDPASTVKSRTWSVNGKAQSEDEQYTTFILEEVGNYKITLCVNGTENCLSKWVQVRSLGDDPSMEDKPIASIQRIAPSGSYEVTKSSSFKIELELQNVEDESQIQVVLNERKQDFSFDAVSGLLTKNLRLKEGGNEVEVIVSTDDSEIVNGFTIEREKQKKKRDNEVVENNNNDRKKDVSQSTTEVEILTPQTNTDTEEPTQIVTFRTKNLIGGKQAIQIRVNDNLLDNKKINRDRKNNVWTVEVSLKYQKNSIKISANTASDEIFIDCNYVEIGKLGNAGPSYSDYDPVCADGIGKKYNFKITPKQPMEILSFILNTTQCGGINIEMDGPKGKSEVNKALVRGKNQIDFDIGIIMEAGLTYTISCATYDGHPSCSSKTTPELIDASTCEIKSSSNPHFTLDNKGKNIIFELKYLY